LRDRLVTKSLVFGIFVIFICLSFSTGISGYNKKMSNELTIKNITNSPVFDNDYLNAYWSFDEGNGNTANDYSGHNYDGTVNGASWTTDTPSESGYALDFDGNDDCVLLDNHAEELGFNKTDDLIFSFHFKSDSNDKGIIYSASHAWGTNPEVHIYLDDDGTIGFQIKVTSCGFDFNTDDTYNDGDWHYVEIWYNGISCEPTVTIFVDDQFEKDITHWVCPFTYNEFDKVKIGRRCSNETNFYEGIIDELKIIKYPGGNEQNPPEIDGAKNGEPDVEYFYTFKTIDPEGDEIWLWIDWDDGNIEEWIGPYDSEEVVTVSHIWEESGYYSIKAKSKDIWHNSHSNYYPVIIGNQPPDSPEIIGPKCGDAGEEYDFTFISHDSDEDIIEYYIDWGDGENTGWLGPYPSGEQITLSHTWDLEGEYEIKAKAKDGIAGEGEWSQSTMIIGNTAPEKPTINGPLNGIPNVELEYTFNAIDPDGDDLYYFISWGDGANITNYGPISSGQEIRLSHTWTKRGEFDITAKVKDPCDTESPLEKLRITIPRNKATLNTLILRILERFSLIKNILIK
jgi:hypothetical protein